MKQEYKQKKSIFSDLDREIILYQDKLGGIKDQLNKVNRAKNTQDRRKRNIEGRIDEIRETSTKYDNAFDKLIKEIKGFPPEYQEQIFEDYERSK